MGPLVLFQRWWRRHLMARYIRKAKKLEAQQEILQKKMSTLQTRIQAIDGLEGRKNQNPRSSSVESGQSLPSLKHVDSIEDKLPIDRLKSQRTFSSSMRMQPLKLQSPVTMMTDAPAAPTPTHEQQRFQEAIDIVEKSLLTLIRILNTSFARKANDTMPSHAPVVVPAQAQQNIFKHLHETHTHLINAIQISESSEWTQVVKFDEPLPYTLGSLPWKRLMDDWAQGEESKIGELTRWLALALNPEYNEQVDPLEVLCLQPVVLEGFLQLVVPTLQQHKQLSVQTKRMHATMLRIELCGATTNEA